MAQITAGVAFKWGAGGANGAKPTTWKEIPDITDIPEIGGSPETADATPLSNLVNTTSIPLLSDTGGANGLTAIDTPEFRAAWEEFVEASNTENGAWGAIEIPGKLNQRLYFKAIATPLGFGGASVNSLLTTTAYFTITSDYVWEDITASV